MYLWDERYVTMTRGDTLSFGMIVEGLGGQDLETVYFTCRRNHSEPPVFQKSLGNGISKTGAGEYVIRAAPEDTKDLEPGKYFYDLEIGVNGDIFTVLNGVLEMQWDVTTE